jgi:hypothetical protein
VADVDGLAARWRLGPGTVERVIGEIAARRPSGDAGAALDAAARAHIAVRLEHVATPSAGSPGGTCCSGSIASRASRS